MSLDPFIPPNSEVRALLVLTGAKAWKLWGPHDRPTDVYVTLHMNGQRADVKVSHGASLDDWRTALTALLNRIKAQCPEHQ